MYKVAIITLSDRASQGIYEDESGKYLVDSFNDNNFKIEDYKVIPDDNLKLEKLINEYSKSVDLIITTGGTGLSSHDITVDVVESLIDYEIRGMTIALHQYSLSKSYGAMFSRAVCGALGKTMIITMPGSLKAVKELCELFIPHLEHGLDHLNDMQIH